MPGYGTVLYDRFMLSLFLFVIFHTMPLDVGALKVSELKEQLKLRGLSAGRLRKAGLALKLRRAIEEEAHLFAAAAASDEEDDGVQEEEKERGRPRRLEWKAPPPSSLNRAPLACSSSRQ